LSNLVNFNGKPIGKLFIETVLNGKGEGRILYEWPKIGETKLSTKYGFIKRATFGEEIYLVCLGSYVEDYLLMRNTENIDEVPIPLRKGQS